MEENEAEKNKKPIGPDGIDEWLNQQLGPGPEQANRVVLRALAEGQTGPKPRRLSWQTIAAATAGLCVVAAMMVLIFEQFTHRQPQISAPDSTAKTDIVATITNESGPVELRLQDNAIATTSSGNNKALASEPRIRIFNEDGLVAAQVIDGSVSYLVIGGEK
jgi:hypothetical protein